MKLTIETYNGQVFQWSRKVKKGTVDDFVLNDNSKLSWSEGLKNFLTREIVVDYAESIIRNAMYRPFTKVFLYFDKYFNERRYQMPYIYPQESSENLIICAPSPGSTQIGFFISKGILDLNFFAGSSPVQCFPFYTYDEDGTNRRENITDWALERFREQYKDKKITKWDIFHYAYGLLHHPEYREKYAANLRRELPRIPFGPEFWAFAKAGKRLADLHVNYEDQPEYELKEIENKAPPSSKVVKIRLSKDKREIIYNDFLTLAGIPPETFEYKLGSRSALEWIVDQYRIKIDKRSGIESDPNRADDREYIIRLIKKVITVSLETVKVINQLKELGISE